MRPKIPTDYRQPLWGGVEPRLRKAMSFSGALAAAVLCVVFLAPLQSAEVRDIEDVPERFAKLILAKKKPTPPPATAPAPVEAPPAVEVEKPKPKEPAKQPDVAQVENIPKPKPKPTKAMPKDVGKRREQANPKPKESNKGQAGRTRAQKEVTKSVAAATKSVESTLDNLTADLSEIGSGSGAPSKKPSRRRGRSKVGRGRAGSDVGGSVAQRTEVGSDANAEGAFVSASQIDIESITDVRNDIASSDSDFVAGSSDDIAPGAYRSNASLIAVVRKYAAGVQFCYDNELKRSPGLDGKMVVLLTVLASGRVLEAKIQQDSLDSPNLSECVLTQIRSWKFPPISEGNVTFRAPFVFTPPVN